VIVDLLPIRSIFFNILTTKDKIIYAKAAGTFCTLISNELEKGYSKIKIPSGLTKYIYNYTFVRLGRNSNILSKQRLIGKAGDNVRLGLKSSVRGIAMNPVDHPHGGRTKSNSPEKTPWGKIAKKNK